MNSMLKTIGNTVLDKLRDLASPQILVSILVIIIAFVLWKVIRKVTRTVLEKTSKLSADKSEKMQQVSRTMLDIVKAVIIILTILLVLGINGINVGALIASLGVASAVVGLALQDYLKDIIMGIHIMTDDFFDVGDVVLYNGIYGKVEEFNLRTTKLKDIYTTNRLTVCNRNISEISRVGEMGDLYIPLPYEEPTEHINAVLTEACEEAKKLSVIHNCVYKGMQSLDDSSVSYLILYFCNPSKRPDARRAVLRTVKEHLDREGIEIPYNQLDVHEK